MQLLGHHYVVAGVSLCDCLAVSEVLLCYFWLLLRYLL